MNTPRVSLLSLLIILLTAGCRHTPSVAVQEQAEPTEPTVFNDPIESYRVVAFDGWTIRVSDRLRRHKELADESVEEVKYQLHRVETVLPKAVVAQMKQTEIWLEHRFPGAAQYHHSVKYLTENGYNPLKAKKIEIPVVEDFLKYRHKPEITLLHELFHAWHDQTIGFDDRRVVRAYNRALKSGNYTSVYHLNGKKVKHYAMSNPMEYFAEMSEAYFLVNDYFPFVRVELQQSDPETYALIKSIWKEAAAAPTTK